MAFALAICSFFAEVLEIVVAFAKTPCLETGECHFPGFLQLDMILYSPWERLAHPNTIEINPNREEPKNLHPAR
jgi:hypothetical protein